MENKKRIKISITAFRATDNPSACEEFMEGHANVLKDIGVNVNKLTSAKLSWSTSPESNVIIARSLDDGKLMGAARVDIGGHSLALPIEEAVGELDEKIYDLVKYQALHGGTGELCGLWTARKVAGRGIAVLLLRAGVSIATQLNLNSLLVLCSEATLSMLTKMGCIINTSVGNNGTFYYPKEDLLATALIIPDTKMLEAADEINKKNIFDLRFNPQQNKIATGPRGEIEIEYGLLISKNNT